jgi:uncharacterized protein (TIGR00255 family)
MTGYGQAHYQSDNLSLSIELRALNNRYLKVTIRAPEPYNALELEIEKSIRRVIRRGTIQVGVQIVRQTSAQDFQINAVALNSYLSQLRPIARESKLDEDETAALLSQVLALPGVVPEAGNGALDVHSDWPLVERVLEDSLGRLQIMRQEEGRAMGQELLLYRDQITGLLNEIRARAEETVSSYRDRLHERVRKLLSELDVEIDRSELIKEVSIFAERSDIAEEVVRLASHLDQFKDSLGEPDSPGRKLEFLTQEMSREANTIGSKAGDVEITRRVVEIKGILEKVRELVQNVE